MSTRHFGGYGLWIASAFACGDGGAAPSAALASAAGSPSVAGAGGASGGQGGAGEGGSSMGGNRFECEPRPVCGNGVIERSGSDFICAEDCDGADLAGEGCESLGYVGGALACSECTFETSGCARCEPLDAELISCAADSTRARYRPLIAATDDDVAVVWDDNQRNVWFQRFTPELNAMDAPRLLDGVQQPRDLVATPTGWMLAVQSSAVDVLALDASGTVLRSLDVAGPVSMATDAGPNLVLVPRREGGPLLLWRESAREASIGSELHAALIAADGASAQAAGKIADLEYSDFTATFATDAFVVVARLANACESLDCGAGLVNDSGSGGTAGVASEQGGSGGSTAAASLYPAWATVRVTTDAQVGAPRLLATQDLASPAIASTPSGGIAMVFQGLLSDVWVPAWQELDATGATIAGPVAIAPYAADVGPNPMTLLPLGTGSLLVGVIGDTSASIGYLRLDGTGTSLLPSKRIASDPDALHSRAVRRGPDIVVAWGSPFGIARLTLNPIVDTD